MGMCGYNISFSFVPHFEFISMKNQIFTLLFLMGIHSTNGQSLSPIVFSSSGNFFSVTGSSLSWTIGEPAFYTFSTGNNILTSGFQQPDGLVTGFSPARENSSMFSIFPNPAEDKIEILKPNSSGFSCHVYDFRGLELFKFYMPAGASSKILDIQSLTSGNYLVRFFETGGAAINTFVISKIK